MVFSLGDEKMQAEIQVIVLKCSSVEDTRMSFGYFACGNGCEFDLLIQIFDPLQIIDYWWLLYNLPAQLTVLVSSICL